MAAKCLEQHISRRDLGLSALVAKVLEFSTTKMPDSIDFVFVAARVSKICKYPGDHKRIREALQDRVAEIHMSTLTEPTQIAQFLWSCRILDLKPNLSVPIHCTIFMQASNKDLINSVWALSHWTRNDLMMKQNFDNLVRLCNEKISSFSNQDLTTLCRCLAITVDNKQ